MTLVVLGNACLDVTHRLDRLPVAGETVNARAVSEDLGGKGLNQAVAARRAGATVRFLAPVGDDPVEGRVRALLAAEGIAPDGLLIHPGRTCDRSTILLDTEGRNIIVTDAALSEGLAPGQIVPRLQLAAGDVLLLQGNLDLATSRGAAEAARRAGARVVLNPAPYRPGIDHLGPVLDAVILNEVEARQWTGSPDPHDAVERIGVPLVVVTLGAAGCLVREDGRAPVHLPAPTGDVVDTTGAGDTFVGTFVAEWAAGGGTVPAARLALAVATGKVARAGTTSAMPSRDDVARLRKTL
jgi:ribokinase